MTFVLWVASHVFKGIKYSSAGALWVAALLLGLANAIVRPILVVLTLPLTIDLGTVSAGDQRIDGDAGVGAREGIRSERFLDGVLRRIFIAVFSFLIYAVITPDISYTVTTPQSGGTRSREALIKSRDTRCVRCRWMQGVAPQLR